jgi:hypothetical protein
VRLVERRAKRVRLSANEKIRRNSSSGRRKR